GRSLIHLACTTPNMKWLPLVELLLTLDPAVVDLKDSKGATCLDLLLMQEQRADNSFWYKNTSEEDETAAQGRRNYNKMSLGSTLLDLLAEHGATVSQESVKNVLWSCKKNKGGNATDRRNVFAFVALLERFPTAVVRGLLGHAKMEMVDYHNGSTTAALGLAKMDHIEVSGRGLCLDTSAWSELDSLRLIKHLREIFKSYFQRKQPMAFPSLKEVQALVEPLERFFGRSMLSQAFSSQDPECSDSPLAAAHTYLASTSRVEEAEGKAKKEVHSLLVSRRAYNSQLCRFQHSLVAPASVAWSILDCFARIYPHGVPVSVTKTTKPLLLNADGTPRMVSKKVSSTQGYGPKKKGRVEDMPTPHYNETKVTYEGERIYAVFEYLAFKAGLDIWKEKVNAGSQPFATPVFFRSEDDYKSCKHHHHHGGGAVGVAGRSDSDTSLRFHGLPCMDFDTGSPCTDVVLEKSTTQGIQFLHSVTLMSAYETPFFVAEGQGWTTSASRATASSSTEEHQKAKIDRDQSNRNTKTRRSEQQEDYPRLAVQSMGLVHLACVGNEKNNLQAQFNLPGFPKVVLGQEEAHQESTSNYSLGQIGSAPPQHAFRYVVFYDYIGTKRRASKSNGWVLARLRDEDFAELCGKAQNFATVLSEACEKGAKQYDTDHQNKSEDFSATGTKIKLLSEGLKDTFRNFSYTELCAFEWKETLSSAAKKPAEGSPWFLDDPSGLWTWTGSSRSKSMSTALAVDADKKPVPASCSLALSAVILVKGRVPLGSAWSKASDYATLRPSGGAPLFDFPSRCLGGAYLLGKAPGASKVLRDLQDRIPPTMILANIDDSAKKDSDRENESRMPSLVYGHTAAHALLVGLNFEKLVAPGNLYWAERAAAVQHLLRHKINGREKNKDKDGLKYCKTATCCYQPRNHSSRFCCAACESSDGLEHLLCDARVSPEFDQYVCEPADLLFDPLRNERTVSKTLYKMDHRTHTKYHIFGQLLRHGNSLNEALAPFLQSDSSGRQVLNSLLIAARSSADRSKHVPGCTSCFHFLVEDGKHVDLNTVWARTLLRAILRTASSSTTTQLSNLVNEDVEVDETAPDFVKLNVNNEEEAEEMFFERAFLCEGVFRPDVQTGESAVTKYMLESHYTPEVRNPGAGVGTSPVTTPKTIVNKIGTLLRQVRNSATCAGAAGANLPSRQMELLLKYLREYEHPLSGETLWHLAFRAHLKSSSQGGGILTYQPFLTCLQAEIAAPLIPYRRTQPLVLHEMLKPENRKRFLPTLWKHHLDLCIADYKAKFLSGSVNSGAAEDDVEMKMLTDDETYGEQTSTNERGDREEWMFFNLPTADGMETAASLLFHPQIQGPWSTSEAGEDESNEHPLVMAIHAFEALMQEDAFVTKAAAVRQEAEKLRYGTRRFRSSSTTTLLEGCGNERETRGDSARAVHALIQQQLPDPFDLAALTSAAAWSSGQHEHARGGASTSADGHASVTLHVNPETATRAPLFEAVRNVIDNDSCDTTLGRLKALLNHIKFRAERGLSPWLISSLRGVERSGMLDTQQTELKLAVPLINMPHVLSGETPLSYAVGARNIPLIQLLLEHRADPCFVHSTTQNSLLHLSSRNRHAHAVKILLEAIGEQNSSTSSSSAKIAEDNSLALQKLLSAPNGRGNTPLHLAVMHAAEEDQFEVEYLLLSKCAKYMSDLSERSSDPIMFEHLQLQHIEEANATSQSLPPAKRRRTTDHQRATEGSSLKIDRSPLSASTASTSRRIPNLHSGSGVVAVDAFLEKLVNAGNSLGDSPLLVSFTKAANPMEALSGLISKKADIHATNSVGRTPLMYAALSGGSTAAAMLLKRGARVNQRDVYGATALNYAILQKDETTATLLIQEG
ncbi:unnamed protein product, partial [Amoebophrya sp. A25]